MNIPFHSRGLVEFTRSCYPPGTRIVLSSMNDPYAPAESGTRGTVRYVDDAGQVGVAWDNGRSLSLIPGVDSFRKMTQQEIAQEQGMRIDMLSFISLHKQLWKSSSYAAACGVSDRVLWQTLKDRPYITKVCLCLDNDEPGQKAARRISKALGDKNICNKILVPTRRDWNEELLFLRKEEAK